MKFMHICHLLQSMDKQSHCLGNVIVRVWSDGVLDWALYFPEYEYVFCEDDVSNEV